MERESLLAPQGRSSTSSVTADRNLQAGCSRLIPQSRQTTEFETKSVQLALNTQPKSEHVNDANRSARVSTCISTSEKYVRRRPKLWIRTPAQEAQHQAKIQQENRKALRKKSKKRKLHWLVEQFEAQETIILRDPVTRRSPSFMTDFSTLVEGTNPGANYMLPELKPGKHIDNPKVKINLTTHRCIQFDVVVNIPQPLTPDPTPQS